MVIYIYIYIYIHFFIINILSFCAKNNLHQWYKIRLHLIIFQCMSSTRSKYSKLGLELLSLQENRSRNPKKPSMVEENKYDRPEDSIIVLFEQALM
jgi:hypothetical protein